MTNERSFLESLQDYYAEHRVLPSYSAMGNLLGLKSKSSVAALVARLKLEGYLETAPDKRLKPTSRFFERELADSVRAGMPTAANDGHRDTLTIDEFLIERPSKTVLLTVKGDSMIDAGIVPGDIAIIEKRPTANVGDIVVAILDNEFTLKTLERDKGQFVLKPANPAYPVIRGNGGQFEIFGVMVGLVRKYK